MKNKYSSRKLIVVAIAFTVGITMSYFKILDETTANFIFKMTVIYLAGNVGMGLANVIKANRKNSND